MGCICNSEKSLKEKNNQTQLNANNNLKLYNQENVLQEAQNINELDKNNDNQKLTINKKIYTEETLPTEKDLNKKNKNNEMKEIQPIKEEDIYLNHLTAFGTPPFIPILQPKITNIPPKILGKSGLFKEPTIPNKVIQNPNN